MACPTCSILITAGAYRPSKRNVVTLLGDNNTAIIG
jgi:hypothetical protein